MSLMRVMAAGAVGGVLSIFSSWLITGALVGWLLSMTAGVQHDASSWLLRGLGLGSLLWLAVALPIYLVAAIYVRWHRGVVIGLLLDSLAGLLLVGCACAFALRGP